MITQTIKETVRVKKITIANNKKESKTAKTLRQAKKEKEETPTRFTKTGNDQIQKALLEYITAQKELRECIAEDEMENPRKQLTD